MQINKIVKKYTNSNVQVAKHSFTEKDIINLQIVGNNPTITYLDNPDILYFVHFDDLIRYEFDSGLSFVILNSENRNLPREFTEKAFFVICVKNEENYIDFIHGLTEDLEIHIRMTAHMYTLVKMVSENRGLKEMVNYISKIYGKPCSVIDTSYSVLANSQPTDNKSVTLTKEYTRGYLDETAVTILKQLNFLTPKEKNTRYQCYDMDETDELFYKRNNYALIYINNIAVAALSIFDNKDIPDEKLGFLENIAFIISTELQKNDMAILNKASNYSHLLSLMIDKMPFDPKIIESRFQVAGHRLKPNRYFVCADPGIQQKDSWDGVGIWMKNIFGDSVYLVMDEYIIFLLTRNDDELISKEEIYAWEKPLRSAGIHISISNSFTNLSEARNYFREAVSTLSTGRIVDDTKCIYLYDDYQVDIVAKLIYKSNQGDAAYYPPIQKLIHYDEENDSSLVETLIEYLKHPKKTKEICDKLYIHKNTLYYRLDKIKNIMGIDFESSEEIAKIVICLRYINYKNRRERNIY